MAKAKKKKAKPATVKPLVPAVVFEPKPPAKPAVLEKPFGSITVTFTGDPHSTSNPVVLRYRGMDFPFGKPVVVDDAKWIAQHGDRVRANRHFKVEG